MDRTTEIDVIAIVLVGAAVLLPFLGQTHDVSSHEIRHAEIAREMAASGDFLTPTLLGQPYRDKPPVLSAAVALLFRASGEPSIALARLPSALAAIAGAIALYGIGRSLADRRAALLAALGVLGVQGYQEMARTARPDMMFTLALLVACLASLSGLRSGARSSSWLALAGTACAVGTALSVWVVPVVLRDRGTYLTSFLTQPDLTTWTVSETVRRMHWPWMYGLVGFLPFTLLLPFAVVDSRRRGLDVASSIALAMLVILSVIPKKRMHYSLPVYPFLALAVAAAVTRRAERRSIARAARALVTLSLVAAPIYFGIVLPRLRPGESADLSAARAILRITGTSLPIVAVGEVAEAIAFVGRRGTVTEVTAAEDFRGALSGEAEAYAVAPGKRAEPPLENLDVVEIVNVGERSWTVYRRR